MTESVSARLNREIAQLYGNPEDFRFRINADLAFSSHFNLRISKRALALRAGLHYSHVLKVLNGSIKRPQLETMLLLDEALDQLIEDKEEGND